MDLGEFVRERLGVSGVSPDTLEVEELCSQVDLDEVIEENTASEVHADESGEEWRERRAEEADEQAEIDDLFDRSEFSDR